MKENIFAEEYDKNCLADDNVKGYDVKYYDVKEAPFRVYGVWHDGERYVRFPKELAGKVSDGLAMTARSRALTRTTSAIALWRRNSA